MNLWGKYLLEDKCGPRFPFDMNRRRSDFQWGDKDKEEGTEYSKQRNYQQHIEMAWYQSSLRSPRDKDKQLKISNRSRRDIETEMIGDRHSQHHY